MEGRMKFFYDKKKDVLDISLGNPKTAVSEEIEGDIVVRKEPGTGRIIGFTILNFEKRFLYPRKPEPVNIPIKIRFEKVS